MKLFGRKKKAKEEKPEVRMEFKVAGVTFDNDDGKNRQEILKKFAKIAKKTDIFEPYGGVTERDIENRKI